MKRKGFTSQKSPEPKIEIPKSQTLHQVHDFVWEDNKTKATPRGHTELVSASDPKEMRGFTLIEVVITLTILGLICLILFSAFRLGLSAWERGESLKDEYQKVRIVSQLITQQVKSAVPYKITPQKAEGDYLAFEGNARSLKFVSALPIRGKRPEGLVYARYEFKGEGSEGGRLIVYEERVLNKDFFAEEPKEERAVALLEGVSNVRLEYLREADPLKNQEEEWVEEWQAKDEKRLPKAFKMTIILKNQKGKEEAPISLLASLPANRFEEVRTMPRRRIPGTSVIRNP